MGARLGLGAALVKEVVYDNGQLVTGSLMDYLIPTAAEMPRVDVVHLEHPLPSPRSASRSPSSPSPRTTSSVSSR